MSRVVNVRLRLGRSPRLIVLAGVLLASAATVAAWFSSDRPAPVVATADQTSSIRYQHFTTIEEAQRAVSYRVISPDQAIQQVASLQRSPAFVRWLGPGTDLVGSMYSGLTLAADGNQYLTKLIFVYQGRGKPAERSTAQVPIKQRGTFRLADGREAVWTVEAVEEGHCGWWGNDSPTVVWRAKTGNTSFRVVGIGIDRDTVQRIAEALAASER